VPPASSGRGRLRLICGVDEREKRLAKNEALFREVNERVNDVAADHGVGGVDEYLCECANADCTFKIPLKAGEYETVRADPTQFVVLPLHYTPEIEELVTENERFWIVRKSGEAGDYVEKLDPRTS
jgi:hypothetical protein